MCSLDTQDCGAIGATVNSLSMVSSTAALWSFVGIINLPYAICRGCDSFKLAQRFLTDFPLKERMGFHLQ